MLRKPYVEFFSSQDDALQTFYIKLQIFKIQNQTRMGRLKNNTQNLNRGEKNAKPNKEKVLITPKPFLRKRIIVQPPIENKMILMSMACLQNIITDFRTPCPECKRTELKVEATVHKGIRQFVALSCPCGHRHGDYSMPEGANYAFAHSLMSNVINIKFKNFSNLKKF